jgi:hypothetical protein
VLVNAFPCKNLINYPPLEQCRDIAPNILIAALAASLAYLPLLLFKSSSTLFALQIITGIIAFMGLAILFKIESVNYIIKNVKQIIG